MLLDQGELGGVVTREKGRAVVDVSPECNIPLYDTADVFLLSLLNLLQLYTDTLPHTQPQTLPHTHTHSFLLTSLNLLRPCATLPSARAAARRRGEAAAATLSLPWQVCQKASAASAHETQNSLRPVSPHLHTYFRIAQTTSY